MSIETDINIAIKTEGFVEIVPFIERFRDNIFRLLIPKYKDGNKLGMRKRKELFRQMKEKYAKKNDGSVEV